MRNIILLLFISLSLSVVAQDGDVGLQKVLRLNIISPGVEFEIPISKKSTVSVNGGVGFSGIYKNLGQYDYLGYNGSIMFFIPPFLDVEYKKFYNREKRASKGKNLEYNSGNYWGVRMLINFKELYSYNVYRYANTDFAVGPVWGIQRAYGKFHLQFDAGMIYYFDVKGNNGFFPISFQLNIGYNCKKW